MRTDDGSEEIRAHTNSRTFNLRANFKPSAYKSGTSVAQSKATFTAANHSQEAMTCSLQLVALTAVASSLLTSTFGFSALVRHRLGRTRIRGLTNPDRINVEVYAVRNDQTHAFSMPHQFPHSSFLTAGAPPMPTELASGASSKTQLSALAAVTALPQIPFRIFCDMDGVLCDFSKGIQSVSGRRPEEFGHNSVMWQTINEVHDFFETLDWTPDGRRLWQAIRHTEPDILTGVPPCRHARAGKARWCERELGVDLINHVDKAGPVDSHIVVNGKRRVEGATNVITCWSRNKHHESRHRAVLIDDRVDLGRAWEAAGGIFVHHTSTESTLEQLRTRGILGED